MAVRKFVGTLLSAILGGALIATGGLAASATTTPSESSAGPAEDSTVAMPPHVLCDASGKGKATLHISLGDDWAGDAEIDVAATSFDANTAATDQVIWSKTVAAEPGMDETLTVPVDDRGIRIWVSEDGLSYQGNIAAMCQSEPIAPVQTGNTVSIPEAEDLQYFAAPKTLDGQSVEAKWGPASFYGFYVGSERLDSASVEVAGDVAIPESGLQVIATGQFGTKIEFDSERESASSWNFDYDANLKVPQTPPAPTQDGNSVVIPASDAFTYVAADGKTLEAGNLPLTEDLVVTAQPKKDVTIATGATSSWEFKFVPESTPTPAATTPAMSVPVAEDLSAQNRGKTQTPAQATAGESILVTVGDAHAGEYVNVVMFSTPRDLGQFLVAANGTILVTVPDDLAAGDHRLAVYDGGGEVLGWDPVSVKLPILATTSPDALGSPMGATGITVPFGTIAMAVLLLGAGAAAFILQRRRDQDPTEENS
ncbi:hypothetical protein C7K25_12040 [Gulosibacter molinativorax]|uniref:Bacterial Ig-like domain-containing protein n=1 Tax=Gulosibacter molinativorax TaxID=256821 RepID=A0ABT7CBT2_9MICO|nr:hypothetical protein [Gulosibacter molinativorax]